MIARWLVAILVLPGTALVVVPLALLGLGDGFQIADPATVQFWLASILGAMGLFFGLWTMLLFVRFGEGTAAPWDPPIRLVVRGPYRHVRNPMIVGVVIMLLAESLLCESWWIFGWLCVFFVGNAVYFPRFEEPGLRRRFGQDYEVYCAHVGRWIPRLTPWVPSFRDSPESST